MVYAAAAGWEAGDSVISRKMSFTVESMAWSTAATTGGGPARITSLRASLTVTTRLSASSAACDQLVMDWNGKFPSVPLAPESFTPLRETTTVADVVSLPVLSRTRSPSNDCEGEVIHSVEPVPGSQITMLGRPPRECRALSPLLRRPSLGGSSRVTYTRARRERARLVLGARNPLPVSRASAPPTLASAQNFSSSWRFFATVGTKKKGRCCFLSG